jgi:hypothetical protein
MPVTPFHGGIGLIAKGLAGRRVSFLGYCATQAVIDLESGYFLLRGEWPVHRFLHTAVGATLACGVVVWLCRQVARCWSRRPDLDTALVRWVRRDLAALLIPAGAVGTAALGVVGHLVPDAIMHADVRPFSPFTDANPMYGTLSLSVLHGGLVAAGAVGVALIALRRVSRCR